MLPGKLDEFGYKKNKMRYFDLRLQPAGYWFVAKFEYKRKKMRKNGMKSFKNLYGSGLEEIWHSEPKEKVCSKTRVPKRNQQAG